MNGRRLAGFATLAACLFAFLSAGPLEVAAQDERNLARSARSVARNWADKLITALRMSPRRDEAGRRLALQPLHPYHFEGLTVAQRRRVYDWLMEGLGEVVRDTYSVMDPARLADISRVLEESGAQDWFERYEEILHKAKARINIICRGSPGGSYIRLHCTASDITDGASLGRASAAFELDWLNEPVALDLAVGSIAGEILRGLKPGAVGEVRIADLSAGGEESGLSRYIGGLVEDAMHRRIRSAVGWRSVGGASEGAAYGIEGEIQKLDERKLVLRVWVHLEGKRLYPARRYVSVKSIPGPLLGSSPMVGDTDRGHPREAAGGRTRDKTRAARGGPGGEHRRCCRLAGGGRGRERPGRQELDRADARGEPGLHAGSGVAAPGRGGFGDPGGGRGDGVVHGIGTRAPGDRENVPGR